MTDGLQQFVLQGTRYPIKSSKSIQPWRCWLENPLLVVLCRRSCSIRGSHSSAISAPCWIWFGVASGSTTFDPSHRLHLAVNLPRLNAAQGCRMCRSRPCALVVPYQDTLPLDVQASSQIWVAAVASYLVPLPYVIYGCLDPRWLSPSFPRRCLVSV